MEQFSWTDDLSVKMGEIDNQHKEMIRLINRLDKAMAADCEKGASTGMFADLAEYTAFHFAIEEEYFDHYGYENSIRHKTEHRYYMNRIAGFQNEIESGRAPIPGEVIGFLKEWLIDHIKGSDQIYVECFLRQMLV